MNTVTAGRVLVAAGLFSALFACSEGPSRTGDAALHADVQVSPTPASMSDTRVVVTVRDGELPATDATADLRAEGPGTPVSVSLESEGAGRFRSGPLAFDRAGRWVLVVTVETRAGRRAVFRQPIQVTGPGG